MIASSRLLAVVPITLLAACAGIPTDESSCLEGDLSACVRHSQASGVFPVDPQLVTRVSDQLLGACELDVESCLAAHRFDGVFRERGRAETRVLANRLSELCDGGLTEACAALGEELASLARSREDWSAAAAVLTPACAFEPERYCLSLVVALFRSGRRDDLSGLAEELLDGCRTEPRRYCTAAGFAEAWRDRESPRADEATLAGCQAGDAFACSFLARRDAGPGSVRAGCEQGLFNACGYLAVDGERSAESATWLQRMCDAGHSRACTIHGHWLLDTQPAEHEPALARLDRACELGDLMGCHDWAAVSYNHDIPELRELAIASLSRLCNELERAASCSFLGSVVANEPELESEHGPAIDLLSRGCDGGIGAACRNAADYVRRPTNGPDHERAAYLLWQACQLDDERACSEIAEITLVLGGATQATIQRFRDAAAHCRSEDFAACHEAGSALMDELYEPDGERARPFFEPACDGGFGPSCSRLAWIVESGLAGEPDLISALPYYDRACDLGDGEACNRLGVLHQVGEQGVPRDLNAAASFYSSACQVGFGAGCANLGWMLVDSSTDMMPAPDEARVLAEAGCAMGEPLGCTLLAWLLDGGKAFNAPDPERAFGLYEQACADGDPAACWRAGWDYESGRGTARDYSRAFDRYQTACSGGEATGCYLIADLHLYGRGRPKSHAWSVAALQTACAVSHPQGCLDLGWRYWDGMGVEPDPVRAFELFGRACELGNQEACEIVAERVIPSLTRALPQRGYGWRAGFEEG